MYYLAEFSSDPSMTGVELNNKIWREIGNDCGLTVNNGAG